MLLFKSHSLFDFLVIFLRVVMKNFWISSCFLLAALCGVKATYKYYSIARCECNGRSQYCLRDSSGLHCVDCQGNFVGRHCERCKDGYFMKGAEPSCRQCQCNAQGSVNSTCDGSGRCVCKDGVSGDKCDRCTNGPIGPHGCPQSRKPRGDSGSQMCFCYGHSTKCSPKSGYSVHTITSTFSDGPDGWTAATANGVTPNNVHFRWTPKYHDLEVISKNSLPVYLYAPAPYLGNQLLSYGQNLSFSLRLDRGVRHPSTNDVVLEGSGLRVAASLGDLRSIVPCGQKISYSFRLDEQPGSRWRPQLSPSQFQTLLQNVTTIKIRATFGENGRGYLDNVRLVSARRHGDGEPARWVQTCSCPPGYEGDFCDRCSAGFRRTEPSDGAFSACQRCSCIAGSCDPQTGECYSADETPADSSCLPGFYRNPWQPLTCVRCPCPEGVSCSLDAQSLAPRCDRCPTGTTGPRCNLCQEGYYGNPRGDAALPECRPCRCNGHIDVSVAGSCDRNSGQCLKCLNNTEGWSCEACKSGFYRSNANEACKRCDCDLQGSESTQCDEFGRCRCRPGYEGLKCQRSDCPACFSPIKTKMDLYAAKLKDLETLVSEGGGGLNPANGAALEAALREMERDVDDMKHDTEVLEGLEKNLQGRLSSISRSQLAQGQVLQNIGDSADDVERQRQTYRTNVDQVQSLTEDMKNKLDKAKADLRAAEIPQGDAPVSGLVSGLVSGPVSSPVFGPRSGPVSDLVSGPVFGPRSSGQNLLSSLAQTANNLADKHQVTADDVTRTANDALSDSEKSLDQVRKLMNKENRVKEMIGDLKNTYDTTSKRVKDLQDQASTVSSNAKGESKLADNMMKDIATMERNIPSALTEQADSLKARLGDVRKAVDGHISGFQTLQDDVLRDKDEAGDLLQTGKAAKEDFDGLLDRVNVAKDSTEDSLKRINSNTHDLDDTLDKLRGFDSQIDGNKASAEAAITRLPDIKAMVQQAVDDNDQTKSELGGVSEGYNKNLDSLGNAVDDLQGTIGSLPSSSGLLDQATKLNKDAQGLNAQASAVAAAANSKLNDASTLKSDAKTAKVGTARAFDIARRTRGAVAQALEDIKRLLASEDRPDNVDEALVRKLEQALARAEEEVERRLKPRLQNMEDQEEAHRRKLLGLNDDIDAIQGDVLNLEEILKNIPKGCFNSPPIEEA